MSSMLAATDACRDEEFQGNRAPLVWFQKPKLTNWEETFQFVDEAAFEKYCWKLGDRSGSFPFFFFAQIYICQLITSMKRRIKTKSKYLPK